LGKKQPKSAYFRCEESPKSGAAMRLQPSAKDNMPEAGA
jgi:hypothetical protein